MLLDHRNEKAKEVEDVIFKLHVITLAYNSERTN